MPSLNDIKVFTIDATEDFRGSIFTTYKDSLDGLEFRHDKIAIRYKDVLVGIHGDFGTSKLISCIWGRIFVVLVDARPDSSDYMKHHSYVMSHENRMQLMVPPGIGNSFFVLSDVCVYNYKLAYLGEYVDFDRQFTIKWNDPDLKIKWPHNNPILSERDS